MTTPEGSVSASGWFSRPKFCPSYLLRLFGILALLCLGTAFALSSYSATSALLSSQWHESPTSFPAVTTPIAPASLNGFCETGGDNTFVSSNSVPADHPVRARSRLLVPAPHQVLDPHCTRHAAASRTPHLPRRPPACSAATRSGGTARSSSASRGSLARGSRSANESKSSTSSHAVRMPSYAGDVSRHKVQVQVR